MGGVQLFFTDYAAARLTEIQFYVMQVVARLYPSQKPLGGTDASKYSMFDKVLGSNKIRETFRKSYNFDDIKDYWRKDEATFKTKSANYYLY